MAFSAGLGFFPSLFGLQFVSEIACLTMSLVILTFPFNTAKFCSTTSDEQHTQSRYYNLFYLLLLLVYLTVSLCKN